MEYVLRGANDFDNPIQTVLNNRGIDKSLFEVDERVIEDYEGYDNMGEGRDLLLKHLEIGSKIAIPIDPDFDGYSSFAITYRSIKKLSPNANIEILIHTAKQHGLSDDIVINDDIKLVIMTDSSSNDILQHKQLKERGIDILCLDHHESDNGYSPYAIVINNQLSSNIKNKNSCGAFVCYKFFKAIDDYLFEDIADEYLDLQAFANVADVMDLKEYETRYFVYEGIKNIKNPFLKALIEDNSYDLGGKLNIDKIGWVLSPKINGNLRSGTMEEKMKMAQAFISDDYEFCLEVAKMCKSVKAKQDSTVKSALNKIEKTIDIEKEDKCIIVEVGKTLAHSHTGLVAGKIADKYKLPTLLYRDIKSNVGFVGGSFRGIENVSKDLRNDILNSGLALYSQGHSSAGGWATKESDLLELKKYLNELYKDKEIINGKTYEVDFIMEENNISLNVINELAEYEDEWGNGISAPLILFKNVTICIEDGNIKRPNMIFEIDGIKFIKKFLTTILKDSVLNKGYIFADIVGKVSNNIYNGKSFPQIEVIDINII
jgi:single-stranded-DNA-specific exonuclease